MVAILGQDCSLVFALFSISHPFSIYPSLCGTFRHLTVLLLSSSCFRKMTDVLQMECTSSQELTDPTPPALPPAMELRLFVALSPLQFAMLTDRRPILPDPYSLRFGLRSDPLKLLVIPSRSTCCVPSSSHHKECSHFSLPTYWRRVMAQTLTGLDTSGFVVHFLMNFVGQMSTRRSSTGSKINTLSWPRSPQFDLSSLAGK